MEIHLKIVGVVLIILSLSHVGMPAYFKWKQELTPLSLITRQIFYVHTFFIAFLVLMIGLLCIGYAYELVNDPFGKIVSLGLFIFWALRLVFQFFVYSPNVWRGKRLETVMHIIFSITWTYFAAVFFLAWRS